MREKMNYIIKGHLDFGRLNFWERIQMILFVIIGKKANFTKKLKNE